VLDLPGRQGMARTLSGHSRYAWAGDTGAWLVGDRLAGDRRRAKCDK
jgi:hypothetical protein